jgi:hypothetical protein
MKLLGMTNADFDILDQVLTTNSAFVRYWKVERKWQYSGRVHKLFIDFEKAYDSVRGEVLYNILTEYNYENC